MTRPERLIRNDRKVDRFNLEVENEVQADLFGHYAREASNEKEVRDEKKAEWEKTAAKVRMDIKTGAYKSYVDQDGKAVKLTKDDVDSLVTLDKDVAKAQKAYIQAEGNYNRAKSDENTMEHRRSSLNNLTTLYSKYYYENKDSGNGFTSKSDQISEAQTKALNKKKTK